MNPRRGHRPPVRSNPDESVITRPPKAAGWSPLAGRPAMLIGGDLIAILVAGSVTAGPVIAHLVVAVAVVTCLARLDLYRFRCTVSLLDHLPWLALASLAGVVTATVIGGNVPGAPITTVLSDTTVVAGVLISVRGLVYLNERRRRLRRAGTATLIVGTGNIGRRLGQAILEHPEYGLRLVGYLDEDRRRPDRLPTPRQGHPRELGHWIEELGVGNVVVTFGVAGLVDVVRTCDRLRCEVFLVPRLFELHSATSDTDHIHGLPIVRMRRVPFRRLSWQAKRLIDIICAGTALIALSPVLLLCAMAVRLEGGRGVLFRQERVGVDGRHFQMYKFRTMAPTTSAEAQQRWTIAGDPRIGPVGRILRATSLDELPQLMNVLRGDMSLVGPRPERPYFVDQLSQCHPRYRARHRVPVGLTGWAAVHGLRGDTSISERVEFDNAYIQNWSLWLDAKIMLRTLGAVLGRTGA